MPRFFSLLAVLLALSSPVLAQNAPPTATPAPVPSVVARSSNSDEFRRQLRLRIGDALQKRGQSFDHSFDFVFLVQVARYSQSDPRLSDLQSGLQAFLERDLLAARRSKPRAGVNDTISLVRYHFNAPVQEASGQTNVSAAPVWGLPLRDYLDDAAPLKKKFTFDALPDRYGDGQMYLDGHDWRRALMDGVREFNKQPLRSQNAVFVVLDWNSLSQAPMVRASGAGAGKANEKFLVAPQNAALYGNFKTQMTRAHLFDAANGDGLETVQVGELEYAMNVFSRPDLSPVDAAPATAPPVAAHSQTPAPPPPSPSGGGSAWPLLLFLLPVGAFLFLGLRPTRLRLNNSKVVSLSFLRAREVAIIGQNGKVEPHLPHFALPLPAAPTSALATLRVDLLGHISAHDGSYSVQNVQGFAPSGDGLRLGGASGELDIKPRAGGAGARLAVKKTA